MSKNGRMSIPTRVKKLGYKTYREYLDSPHWAKVKGCYFAAVKAKHGKLLCEKCGSTHRLQVHHKRYKRLGGEVMEDLQLLCGDCHHNVHHKLPNPNWKPPPPFSGAIHIFSDQTFGPADGEKLPWD